MIFYSLDNLNFVVKFNKSEEKQKKRKEMKKTNNLCLIFKLKYKFNINI